jgi:hypothetical protein
MIVPPEKTSPINPLTESEAAIDWTPSPARKTPLAQMSLPTTDAEHVAFYERSRLAGRHEVTSIGYIYALHIPEFKAVKIGRTIDPLMRVKQFQIAHPRPLRWSLLLATLTSHADEQNLHARFAEYQIQSEWFTDSPDVLAWVKAEHPHSVPGRPLYRGGPIL